MGNPVTNNPWKEPSPVVNKKVLFNSNIKIIDGYDFIKLRDAYKTDGQSILKKEYEAGVENTYSKQRWKDLYNKNTCAIKLSWALNNFGYIIKEHKTMNDRITWSSNLNTLHQYILSADEMGQYLKKTLGPPSIKSNGPIESDSQLDEFMKKFEGLSQYGGIIYLDSLNYSGYGATGHVDLLYERDPWYSSPYPYIHGSSSDLEDYVDYRNNDGWLNSDAKLAVHIWLLKGKLNNG